MNVHWQISILCLNKQICILARKFSSLFSIFIFYLFSFPYIFHCPLLFLLLLKVILLVNLIIGVGAHVMFGEHERHIRVARRVAVCSSSLLCALHILDIRTAKSINQFFRNTAIMLHLVSKIVNQKFASSNQWKSVSKQS